jgi:hypothetical protein
VPHLFAKLEEGFNESTLLEQLPKNKQLDIRLYGGCSLVPSFAEVGSLGSI